MPKAAARPPTKVGLRSSERSNIGSRRACSRNGNVAEQRPPRPQATTITRVEPQPADRGLDQSVDEGNQPEREDAKPGRSIRRECGGSELLDADQGDEDRDHPEAGG